MDYYVYDNWRRNWARVHRADCRYCNGGMGLADLRGTHDEFLGPYNRAEAFKVLKGRNRRAKGPCGVCQP